MNLFKFGYGKVITGFGDVDGIPEPVFVIDKCNIAGKIGRDVTPTNDISEDAVFLTFTHTDAIDRLIAQLEEFKGELDGNNKN